MRVIERESFLYFFISSLLIFLLFYFLLFLVDFFYLFLPFFYLFLRLGLAKNLVSKTDQDSHLKAQGMKFMDRTSDALKIPPIGKGSVKTTKIMLDLDKVR